MAQLSASLEAPGHVLPGEPTLWSCCDSRPATFVWSPSFHPAAFRHLPMRPPRRQLDLVEPPPLAQSWPTALDFFQSPTFLRSSNPPCPSGSTLLLSIHPPWTTETTQIARSLSSHLCSWTPIRSELSLSTGSTSRRYRKSPWLPSPAIRFPSLATNVMIACYTRTLRAAYISQQEVA